MKNKVLLFILCSISWITLMGCTNTPTNKWNNNEEHWFNIAEWYCKDAWWELETLEEWDGYIPICYYKEDNSFCYYEDLYDKTCKKWDIQYNEYDYEDDLYPYAEEACIDSDGLLSQTEDGYDICILNDNNYCYIDEIIDWECNWLTYDIEDIYEIHAEERAYQEYIAECYEQEQITVCGQDWNSYYNRCFMEKAWIEEETELAEVIDWECVYW